MAISIDTGIRSALIEGQNINKARDFTDILGDVINTKGFCKKLDTNLQVVDNGDGTITIKKGIAFVRYTKLSGEEGFVKCELSEDKTIDISGEADGTYYVSFKLNQDRINEGSQSVSGDDIFTIEINENEYDYTIAQVDKSGTTYTITDKRERVKFAELFSGGNIEAQTYTRNGAAEMQPNGLMVLNNDGDVEAPSGKKFVGDGSGLSNVPGGLNTLSQFTAGENLTAGDAVYVDGNDGKVYKTDASDSNKIGFIGFAQATVSAGNSVNVATAGVDSNQSGLTVGADYYLSDTAGAIDTTPGTNKVKVGRAVSDIGIRINDLKFYKTYQYNYTTTVNGNSTTNITINHNLGKKPNIICYTTYMSGYMSVGYYGDNGEKCAYTEGGSGGDNGTYNYLGWITLNSSSQGVRVHVSSTSNNSTTIELYNNYSTAATISLSLNLS